MSHLQAPPSSPAQIYTTGMPLIDRDLSWLQFNFRVLEEAEDTNNLLLERVKFLAITALNLNEFYMVRVSALETLIAQTQRKNDEIELARLLPLREEIYKESKRFIQKCRKVLKEIRDLLAAAGILLIEDIEEIKKSKLAKAAFEKEVLPLIPKSESFTPEKLLDLNNLEVAVIYSEDQWVRLPKTIPGMIMSESSHNGSPVIHCFFLDHLLYAFLAPVSSNEVGLIRLTRSANDSIDLPTNDPDCIPDTVLRSINKRDKGRPVRLELHGSFKEPIVEKFRHTLKLEPQQIFLRTTTLFLQSLWLIVKKTPEKLVEAHNLKLKPLVGWVPRSFRKHGKIFERLDTKDYLLHHPYDSFDSYVAFIKAASRDPEVTKIEQTFYRTDEESQVVAHLKEAAKTKHVHVCIESRARFDELNNLRLAQEFKKAGVKVTFATGKLKLHAKIALITRKTNGQIKYYTHLSTGNYNAITSSQYTDLAIITSNQDIGADARQFFDSIYSQQVPSAFRKLVIAPQFLARRMLSYIKEETETAKNGKAARIFIKVNALVDPKVIEALYVASQAGVKVDLVVRGACSLVPEIPGISENIRVLSIVDRFLEHSRIYYFESAKKLYLSSADCMPRNFFSRLEVAFPILDPRILAYLENILIPTYLNDYVKARQMTSSGAWKRRRDPKNETSRRAQQYFEKLSESGYLHTELE